MRIDLTMKLATAVLLSMFFLTGCGIFGGEDATEKIDAPPEGDAETVEDLEDVSEDESEDEQENLNESDGEALEEDTQGEEVSRVLYLLDQNGLVVPHEVNLPAPESKEVAKQVLEYLVKDGPVTSMLPNGFEAVLPSGTDVIDLNLEADGTLVVNVSEDFKTYQKDKEKKILESMTYTLTQFENVSKVKLWIDGEEQNSMPVNGTPISEGYSRVDGINIHQANGIDLMESEATTLYFPMQGAEEVYFVPVTQHVPIESDKPQQSIAQALMKGPALDLPLQHFINTGSQLTTEPVLKEGILSLTFNENILSNSEKSVIAEEVMQSIVLTLTEQEEVEAVNIQVENHEEVMNEDGQPYTDPVTKEIFSPEESI